MYLRTISRKHVVLVAALATGALTFSTTSVLAATPTPPIKVTQTASDTAPFGNSVTCNSGGVPTENHFYRRFDLAASHGASQGFVVSQITLAVEASAGGTKPGSVKISAIDAADPFTLANLEPISSTPVNLASVADGAVLPVTVNATVPAGKQMVLEVQVDGGSPGIWFPGSNALAETAPSYLRAADCGVAEPATVGSIGFPTMHLVLFANGKAVDCVNAEAAVTAAETALASAQSTAAKAATKAKKAKKKLKKAKKAYNKAVADFGSDSDQAKKAKAKKVKAAKKAKKAKKASKAAAAAVVAAQASLTAKQAAVTAECAQPALPAAARPAPATPGVTGPAQKGFSFSTAG